VCKGGTEDSQVHVLRSLQYVLICGLQRNGARDGTARSRSTSGATIAEVARADTQ
jgi:hypothetical protein